MLNLFFAHTEDTHVSTGESLSHYLESAPTAILVWAVISITILLIVLNVFKMERPGRLLTLAAFNLIYGVFLYDKSPEVGAVIISVGFIATLWSVVIGMAHPEPVEIPSKGAKIGKK